MIYISKEEYLKLNEKERRLKLGEYALEIGYGGISQVSARYGASKNTVKRGIRELKAGETYVKGTRIRADGAGRPSLGEKYPEIAKDILEIADKNYFMIEGNDKKQLGTSCNKIAAYVQEKYQRKISTVTVLHFLTNNGYECPRSKPKSESGK